MKTLFTKHTIVIFLLGCIPIFFLVSCYMCGSEVFQEVLSPDGKNKIVVFERNCGATTGFSTHISLLKSNITIGEGGKDRTGNIFQADGYPDWFEIKVKWEDDKHVIIEHNGKPIPHFAEESIRGVKIQYFENLEGILPNRPFAASELLLPVSHFPQGWTSEEKRFSGREVIKGSKENSPYMLYTPPTPAKYWEAGHYIDRLDNVDQALKYFQRELKVFLENFSANCVPSNVSLSKESIFKSEYSMNYAVGYADHKYSDGSGEPGCKMIAQYDEFFIEFNATISNNGLTYQQFNSLVKIIDQIMIQNLQE